MTHEFPGKRKTKESQSNRAPRHKRRGGKNTKEGDLDGLLNKLSIANQALAAEIEHRRETEAALEETRKEQNKLLAERTKELSRKEEQLLQSQKMEAIGMLAGGIAHDFNNMLSIIIGHGEILMDDVESGGEVWSGIEEIVKAGERAAALTRQLLAFSRRQIMRPRLLDPNEIVSGMEKMIRRIIGEDIEFVVNLRPDVDHIEADPSQIEQVILNLAVNARDAMPQGGSLMIQTRNVELDHGYVEQHLEAQAGPHVMIAISDSGEGMSPEVQERLFEPFFTTKEKGKGTGLGLSTVYGIVKQSGGTIWVYSEPGIGSAFKVYLPRARRNVKSETVSSKEARSVSGTETILLVEDELGVRELAKRILQRSGYTVLDAENASGTIAICKEYPDTIHLLITDVILPGKSGGQIAEEVRGLRSDIKVLFMSGYTDESIAQRGVLKKGILFIEKPIRPRFFLETVRDVLDKSSLRG